MIALTIDVTMRQQAFVLQVRESMSVEVLGVFGPSGSGKTSLLEAIAGIRTPDEGEIRVGDRVLFSSGGRINVPARERRIGYVPQDALLFPNMNVRDNVAYGAQDSRRAYGGKAPRGADYHALVEMLDLTHLAGRSVANLSGGEKQRVAIARALMTHPSLLLLDEPLAGVDRERRDRILPYVLKIRRGLHVPLIYVTHEREEMAAIADRVLHLSHGAVVAEPAAPGR